ncbi:hypothetical protein [Erwinia amylovora]|uniref:hypothetical protein n=1 Tax=Erwinia amylovora TaxID=552 RepID=UPI0015D4E087|nr:hypothetical protein [Erwinia amylovora]
MLAAQYLHCPANWNGVVRDGHGMIAGAVKPAKMVTFTNRPDETLAADGLRYGRE